MTADVTAPAAPPASQTAAGSTRQVLPALTVALCSALLFLVEPLTAKLLLPLYGGTAAVWTGSVLFFQVVLLLGYALVHGVLASGPGRPTPLRLALAAVLVALPALVLPLHVPDWAAPREHAPLPWLLLTLAVMVGLPFLALSIAGPLVSSWLSGASDGARRSPYRLYAASNAGSLGGLLAYPFLAEPLAHADAIRRWWSIGYVVAALLLVACAVVAARRPRAVEVGLPVEVALPVEDAAVPTRRERLNWLALSALPVSLMLGTTTVLTTDVAPVPLLWVVPLALYLLTLAIAFAPVREAGPRALPSSPPVLLGVLALAAVASTTALQLPKLVQIAVDLAVLTVVALLAHQRLAATRPPARRLTEFYLVVALGGALGGAFNSLVAPLVFVRISEFPLALLAAIALLVLPGAAAKAKQHTSQLTLAVAELGTLAVPLVFLLVARVTGAGALVNLLIAAGLLAAGWLLGARRPLPLSLGVAGILLLTLFPLPPPLQAGRNFYGSYSVAEDRVAGADRRLLTEGTTVHGWQYLDPARRDVPTSYYSTTGPIGDVFRVFGDDPALRQVDLVGLGAGTLAAYGRPGQSMRFYELDPQIVDVARDPKLFTYLADSKAMVTEQTGDGRLLLAQQPAGSAGLLVLDAFSSDAIPTHLLTAEAFRGYARVLQPDGLIAVHITNRFLDLAPVLAGEAKQAGMTAVIRDDLAPSRKGDARSPSRWVVLARNGARLDPLRQLPGWRPLPTSPSVDWTDDYSSVVPLIGRGGGR